MGIRFGTNTSDIVNFGDKAHFISLGDLTWNAWVRFESGGGAFDQIIVIEGGSGEAENENAQLAVFVMGSSDDWDIRYIHEHGLGVNEDTDVSHGNWQTSFGNDFWHHIAIVRDTANLTVNLWVDGALFGPVFNYTNQPTYTGSTTEYAIGKRPTDVSLTLTNASVERPMLHHVALRADEVRACLRGEIIQRGLIHAAKLNGVSIQSPELDLTGFGNHGLVTDVTLTRQLGPFSGHERPPAGFNREPQFYWTRYPRGVTKVIGARNLEIDIATLSFIYHQTAFRFRADDSPL